MHTTIPPMPATNCPRWCQQDHEPSWQQWAGLGVNPPTLPGITGPGTPVDEWLGQWEPYHSIKIGSVEGVEGDAVGVDLVRIGDDRVSHLFLEGGGSFDAAQTRQLAAMLLDAAEELERVQR